MEFTCYPAGDRAVTVKFKQEISDDVNRNVIALAKRLEEKTIAGVEECVPAYASLLVYYNPMQLGYAELVETLHQLDTTVDGVSDEKTRVFEIPVLYGGKEGPDLEDVADYHGLTTDDVIRLHCGRKYRIYMLGFTPGFPYLGGLDPRLHTPRLETPRTRIPAGSIGIAGNQTGIYSLSTPGGWRLIGHTPVPLFTPENPENPVLLNAGDYIRFVPVSRTEYERISEEIKDNRYSPRVSDA
ncbi:MAG: 5-oxoprolinase subunit PxpB [Bacillaceae bacterium]|nr:5-oxoprolinase subunit PxpB [Bacillaceae bacterium]